MKKLLYIILFSVLLLSGCEKKPSETAPASLFELKGDTTAAGISIGDGSDEFQKAYGGYMLQVAWNDTDSTYMVMDPEDIPYDEEISTIITTLFVNGAPVTTEQLCKEHDLTPDQVHSLLSSAAYLRKHEVIFRYLDFDWKNGKIASISSEELNYNETFGTPYSA